MYTRLEYSLSLQIGFDLSQIMAPPSAGEPRTTESSHETHPISTARISAAQTAQKSQQNCTQSRNGRRPLAENFDRSFNFPLLTFGRRPPSSSTCFPLLLSPCTTCSRAKAPPQIRMHHLPVLDKGGRRQTEGQGSRGKKRIRVLIGKLTSSPSHLQNLGVVFPEPMKPVTCDSHSLHLATSACRWTQDPSYPRRTTHRPRPRWLSTPTAKHSGPSPRSRLYEQPT